MEFLYSKKIIALEAVKFSQFFSSQEMKFLLPALLPVFAGKKLTKAKMQSKKLFITLTLHFYYSPLPKRLQFLFFPMCVRFQPIDVVKDQCNLIKQHNHLKRVKCKEVVYYCVAR